MCLCVLGSDDADSLAIVKSIMGLENSHLDLCNDKINIFTTEKQMPLKLINLKID
jgi:hypothetical protein